MHFGRRRWVFRARARVCVCFCERERRLPRSLFLYEALKGSFSYSCGDDDDGDDMQQQSFQVDNLNAKCCLCALRFAPSPLFSKYRVCVCWLVGGGRGLQDCMPKSLFCIAGVRLSLSLGDNHLVWRWSI